MRPRDSLSDDNSPTLELPPLHVGCKMFQLFVPEGIKRGHMFEKGKLTLRLFRRQPCLTVDGLSEASPVQKAQVQ